MKTAYAISIGDYVEDIILGSYDDARKFAEENYWDGAPPKFDGDFNGDQGSEILIQKAQFHRKEEQPTVKELLDKFLLFGEAFDELNMAVNNGRQSGALYWATQAQCDLSVIATKIAETAAHSLKIKEEQ